MNSNFSEKSNKNSQKTIIIIVVCVIFAFLSIFCCLSAGILIWVTSDSPVVSSENMVPNAYVEISVDDDACGVIRGEVQGSDSVDSLTWVITDMDDYSVLERNAENEYQYRYFRSGTYKVHIKAWYDGAYHQISDEVIIDCK